MRIVFFGSPAAALPTLGRLIGAGHAVVLVVTQPDKPAGRGRRLASSPVKAFALEHGIPTFEPARIRKDESALGRVHEARPDVNVVVAYGQIIPGPIIDLPRRHSLNVHFSLLPKYRGAAPVARAILAGDPESGVTVIELNEKMDEGDILAKVRTPVGPRETASELEARLAGLGADLLLETLERIDTVGRIPQDHSLATLAPKIRVEEARIDWTETAEKVDRRVRAMSSRPGAFTFFRGRRLIVRRGLNLDVRKPGVRPGEVLAVRKEGIRTAGGEATIYLIESLQPEGKTAMTAHAFSLGAGIAPGAAFENE